MANDTHTSPKVVDLRCNAVLREFICTHLKDHKGDHAETQWMSNVPYTVAWWAEGSIAPVTNQCTVYGCHKIIGHIGKHDTIYGRPA